MDKFARLGICALALGLAAGCRTATRVIDEPRVDFELPAGADGNRGYLVGNPPPERLDRKATRKMVETEIELPATGKAEGEAPEELESSASSPESDESEGEANETEAEEVATSYDSYTVQKGDTLWSIAAKPEIYNDATKWRKIFKANEALLKSPDRIRVGMTLQIPRGGSAKVSNEQGEKIKVRYSK
jgi:LysM repeat protein